MGDSGLVRVATPADVTARKDAEFAARNGPPQPEINLTGLVADIRKGWLQAREAKQTVEREMIAYLRQREGEFSPEALAQLSEAGKTAIFAPITSKICRAFEAWAHDILFQSGDKAWGLDPTPIPDLNPEQKKMAIAEALQNAVRLFHERGLRATRADFEAHLMNHVVPAVKKRLNEQAEVAAGLMEDKIEDQFEEGGFYSAVESFLSNLGPFHTAFIKGPISRTKRDLKWMKGPDGRTTPVLIDAENLSYTAPAPLDMYPGPSATNCNDGDLYERMRLHRADLIECKGLKGFRDDAIDRVLELYENGCREWTSIDNERADLENKENVLLATTDTIEVLDCWKTMLGKNLIAEGIDILPDQTSVVGFKEYEIEAWLVKTEVVYLAFNDHPLGHRPYGMASYETIPGSFWGRCIAERVATPQAMCNGAATSLANNMSLCDGPMIAYDDIGRLPIGEDPNSIHGWKVYQFTNDKQSTNPPIQVIQINDMSEKFMAVYDKWKNEADELAGIPPYVAGDPSVSGAGKTLGGLSILQGNASRGLRLVVSHIDAGIIKPMVYLTFVYNMLYDPDEAIKGDVQVVTRGALSLLIKEQTMARRQQFLQITNNPTDMAIIGLPGRAKILRSTIGSLDMDADEIVPPDEVIQAKEMAMMQINALQQSPEPEPPKRKQLPRGEPRPAGPVPQPRPA